MHPDQAEFEKKIDENPLDSNTHAVYADWLDDHGQHDEAAFRRAMGEWVRETGARRASGSLRGTNRHFPYVAHPLRVPKGVNGEELPIWNYGPGPDSFRSRDGHYRPQDPTHGVYHTGLLHYQTYRNMEEAFRRSFMANRPQQNRRKLLPRRYFRK